MRLFHQSSDTDCGDYCFKVTIKGFRTHYDKGATEVRRLDKMTTVTFSESSCSQTFWLCARSFSVSRSANLAETVCLHSFSRFCRFCTIIDLIALTSASFLLRSVFSPKPQRSAFTSIAIGSSFPVPHLNKTATDENAQQRLKSALPKASAESLQCNILW